MARLQEDDPARRAAPSGRPGARSRRSSRPSAYRIVQEALSNVVKHAGHAKRGRRASRSADGALELDVHDDGSPAVPADDGSGHGLLGRRERAAHYGGSRRRGADPRRRLARATPGSLSAARVSIRVLIADDQAMIRQRLSRAAGGRAGHRRRRRGRGRRARPSRCAPSARDRRRADGRAHAAHGRARGHPRARGRPTSPAERIDVIVAHHLRPRRVRVRRAAGRCDRLPAQGRQPERARRRDPRGRRRRGASSTPRRHAPPDRPLRRARRPTRSRAPRARDAQPSASATCSCSSPAGAATPRSPTS